MSSEATAGLAIEVHEGFPSTAVVINCPQKSADIQKIISLLQSLDRKIYGVRNGQTHAIDWRDVLYVESVDKHCFVYTAGAVYETSLKLYEFEERYADLGFFRASKAQIVNVARIATLRPEFGSRMELVMENGEKLIVSRQYTHMLKERLGLL